MRDFLGYVLYLWLFLGILNTILISKIGTIVLLLDAQHQEDELGLVVPVSA